MGYYDHPDTLDQNLNYIKNNTTRLVLCEGEPANYSEAQTNKGVGSGKRLGEVTVDASDFGTPANHTPDGREISVNEQASLSVSVTGAGDHIAYVDTVGSKLLHVRPTASTVNVTSGQTGTIPAHTVVERRSAAPA